jgi:hypothetical protein
LSTVKPRFLLDRNLWDFSKTASVAQDRDEDAFA